MINTASSRRYETYHRMKNLLNLMYPLLFLTLASVSAAEEDPPVNAVAGFNFTARNLSEQGMRAVQDSTSKTQAWSDSSTKTQ